VADVLEAVTYVAGVDPLTEGRSPRTIRSRRLACHALRELAGFSYPEIAQEMGYADHKTAMYHCAASVGRGDLRAVRAALKAERPPAGSRS
jgi:hypothetical protein